MEKTVVLPPITSAMSRAAVALTAGDFVNDRRAAPLSAATSARTSCRPQHTGDGRGQPAPSVAFGLQLPPSRRGETVELRPLLVLGELPFGVDPPLTLESMKRRVKRAMIDVEDLAELARNATPMP